MKVKGVFLPSFLFLIIALTVALIPTEAEGEIYGDTLRLHILAESDSQEDQAIKLAIRDAVLLEYGTALKGEGYEGAVATATKTCDEIEEFVNERLSELGSTARASATVSREWYDTREYEGFSMPCGYYTSLRIVIGEGKGQNWWCVMYPPLCLDLACESAPADDALIDYTDEEIRLINGSGYRVKFKLLEIFSSVLQK